VRYKNYNAGSTNQLVKAVLSPKIFKGDPLEDPENSGKSERQHLELAYLLPVSINLSAQRGRNYMRSHQFRLYHPKRAEFDEATINIFTGEPITELQQTDPRRPSQKGIRKPLSLHMIN
jgi:hypothetical protein